LSAVLDASFTSRALLRTQLLPAAANELARLVREGEDLAAPYLLQAEFSSTIRQLRMRAVMTPEEGRDAWRTFLEYPIEFRWDVAWVERAAEIAERVGLSKVYDSIYLACAETYGFELYTCDARFCRALGANLPPFVRLINP
jgi:predicted nucleic acid-binding protein